MNSETLRFLPRALARSESANYHLGDDIRLHLVVRGHEGRPWLIVNDCLGGVWGEELRLPLSPGSARSPVIGVAFTAAGFLITPPGGTPTPFRPGQEAPPGLTPRHGPDVEVLGITGAAAPTFAGDGVIEAAAPLPGTGHWLLVLRLADAALEAALVTMPVQIGLGDAEGLAPALLCALPPGEGVLVAVEHAGDGPVHHVELWPAGLKLVPEDAVAEAPRPLAVEFLARLATAQGPALRELELLLARGFTGRDTLASLPVPLRMQVARLVPTPEGVLLQGWLDDPHRAIARIALRQGEAEWALRPGAWFDTAEYDGQGARGFLARVPFDEPLGEPWLDVTLNTGERATLPLPRPEAREIAALRGVLAAAGELPEAALDAVFDHVLGPPLVALNRRRLARPMAVEEQAFGVPPDAPRASLIIPLHGRLDMLPAQMALFSACGMAGDEVVFVLDDPPRRAVALAEAQSAWERFGVPLRLILPAEGRGFGPASNLGLERSRGRVVCFVNADVFPQAVDWLDHLVAALNDPSLGAVGARLLYPDGSLQHGGMRIEAGHAGWFFPEHPGKGLRAPPANAEPHEVEALTGACIALRRDVAIRLGGFDPDYVIGDFEDADLSARLRAEGLRCVLEDRAALVHLERQSQGRADAERGRWNLTLLNAWTYNRRWNSTGTL